eukprot:SAG31_NODE_371_length_16628_cov_3.741943_15_plen_103_part_00
MSDHDRSRYQLSTGHSRSQLAGVLRSNLANEEFIQWLPETMLAFAEQTGAGGFSFDLCVQWSSTSFAQLRHVSAARHKFSQLTSRLCCITQDLLGGAPTGRI